MIRMDEKAEPSIMRQWLHMLLRDKFALCAAIFLVALVLAAFLGSFLLDDIATKQNLRGRNAPPFDFSKHWVFWLGGDALGRPLLARIIVAARNTLLIAGTAVSISIMIGCFLGLIAGYSSKLFSHLIMRIADVIMSFPSLLLAVIILYMLPPSLLNIVVVLAITRIPVYLRTARAEVLEIRERMFIQAAQIMGASNKRIIFRHILPIIIPTMVTIATLDFAFVMLAESSLSFRNWYSATRNYLGSDGCTRPTLLNHRLVALLLARSSYYSNNLKSQSSFELVACSPGPATEMAHGSGRPQKWLNTF